MKWNGMLVRWAGPIMMWTTCLTLIPSTARAIDWSGTTGSFLQGSNWQGGAVPGLGDEAVINNGGTAQLGAGNVETDRLILGVDGGNGTFVQTDGTFNAGGAFIGENSTGAATITTGEFLIGNESIHVGRNPGGVGTMTINGKNAFVKSGDDYQLGRDGFGILNFSAGQLHAGYTVVGKFGTGTWLQSGGLFDQDFGDVEIGDGGKEADIDTPGPRVGVINLSGGFMQTADSFAIGNRRGTGTVNITGGVLAATGNGNSNIYIGRGMDNSPGTGGTTTLRIAGDASTVIASGNLSMNESDVSSAATLIAELRGPKQTPIIVGGDAVIQNGILKVETNNYTPKAADSWVLVEAGADLTPYFTLIDAQIAAAGYDAITHTDPAAQGEIKGPFKSIDTSGAPLGNGLQWKVSYTANKVTLSVETSGVGIKGDFNGNGTLDAGDIDDLSAAVRAANNPAKYDVTGDNKVDEADRESWVNTLRKTYFGDADLNGEFSSGDFVTVFAAGEYEDANAGNSGWAEGDWDGNGDFDSGDFVAAFSAGGYELGPRAAVSAVPEPASLSLLGLAGLGLCLRARRQS